MDIFARDVDQVHTATQKLVDKLDEKLRGQRSVFSGNTATISLESLNQQQVEHISETAQTIENTLESIRMDIGMVAKEAHKEGEADKPYFTKAQLGSAQQAGVMGGAYKGFANRALRATLPAGAVPENTITVESQAVDAFTERAFARESYDEKDNKSAVAYAITYNLQSARQDEFGEALFPTITIPADQAGVTITVNLLYVMDNIDRNVSGAEYQLKRKNLLRAVADASVLRKDQTLALPVWRNGQSSALMVDPAVIPNVLVNTDGSDFPTGPLLFAKQIDLLGISQTDAIVATGVENQTDTLDPAVDLTYIYNSNGANATKNVLKMKVDGLPYFNFVPAVQGDYKLLNVNAQSDSIVFNKDTKQFDGSAMVGPMVGIVTNNWSVRCRLVLSGNCRTDTGNIVVYAAEFTVLEIKNAQGVTIALNDGSVASLVAALNGSTPVGYDVKAYRSNLNRRQQGQFIDVAKKYQRYMVPLRSPITARHPGHIDGQIDASDVQALITATRIRIANEAVTSILASVDLLSSYVDVRNSESEGPDTLGVGRYFVRPYYITRPFDASAQVDSIKSHERAMDIQAALINEIRDMAYLAYRESEFKAASDALYGGQGPVPTVILATDPYTARYLTVTGDLRTLGGEFQVQVVSTLDTRFRGKIVIAFGIFDGERNTSINPLNNGNLLWAPELVLTANISRGGSYNRETLVQPRYRFIQNLPVLGMLTVTNIPNVVGRVPLQLIDVTP